MIKKLILTFLLFLVLAPFVIVYFGNVQPPLVKEKVLSEDQIHESSHFYHKDNWGVHQVFLSGTPFERGQQFGFWTKDYLLQQEQALIDKLNEVVPSKLSQYALVLFSMVWFQGLDHYFDEAWLQEMYGISLHGSRENRFFATPFTRQLAYHGIHDMGQMMIDKGLVMGACTQVARPLPEGWLVGRNFDFEAGAVFDEDKVLKWVFPDHGVPYVSVIFSGMVGVISGINQQGVYVGINAAGSDDFVRLGTPTTLLAAKALQFATSAQEAVAILQNATPLITDIFVIADRNDTLYVVEKTPKRTRVLQHSQPVAVTNHLQHSDFQTDATNSNRKHSNTTLHRLERAKELLKQDSGVEDLLAILRDKFRYQEKPVYGHRSGIDAMIASHSLIYDSQTMHLFVAKGPSLSQEFIGIDLLASFTTKKPVLIDGLQADPDFSVVDFKKIKSSLEKMKTIKSHSQAKRCRQAESEFKKLHYPDLLESHYDYHWTKAEIATCLGLKTEARDSYGKALQHQPAYAWEREEIAEKLQNL